MTEEASGQPTDAQSGPLIYRSCGVVIRSDRPLPGLASATSDGDDLVLVEGPRQHVPRDWPSGSRIIDPGDDSHAIYRAVRDDDGYLLRFLGHCDVRISPDLRHAEYRRDPEANDGLVDVLLAGTLLAFVLSLKGVFVLHASAVEVDGRALAFVGHSGMGKSTLTVATCAAGARLISEDVLAVTSSDAPACLPGNTDVRLRKAAAPLLERMGDAPQLMTPDGRHATQPPRTTLPTVPLDTVVIPRPSRKTDKLTAETLPAKSAMLRLLNFPRIFGLIDPAVVTRQFEGAAKVAQSVPVRVATVPWGPPFPDDLGEQLIGLMRDR